MSEMSSIVSTDQGDHPMSGVEELSALSGPTKQQDVTSERTRGRKSTMSESFVDPFDVTIDITGDLDWGGDRGAEYSDDEEEEDPDYEPSIDLTIQPRGIDLEDLASDNSEIEDDSDDDQEDTEDTDHQEETIFPGIVRIEMGTDVDSLLQEKFYLITLQQLLLLAKTTIPSTCNYGKCSETLTISTESVGSALYLSWVCPSGHIAYKWCSQPLLNRRLHSGDLLTSAAILMSGNSYSKTALFARMLNLKIVSSSTYLKIQRHYLVPSVDQYWETHQQEIVRKHAEKELVIIGDGRMDSPGFCAQYCSYTFMEYESKDILDIITIDKRQTDRKSTIMEKVAFQQSLDHLLDQGATVKEVATDSHPQITSLMKTRYGNIKHSLDVWHAAKNLGKKITTAGQQKDCRALLQWSRHIATHFWYCCGKATSCDEFKGLWCGVIHHVVNEHSWVLPYCQGVSECDHGPLAQTADRDREWLQKGSPAHNALVKIVMNKQFLNKVEYLINFRHTAELESFQQNILMYSGKRFAYTPPVYRARNRLAAIDHNVHNGRPIKKNKKGEVVFHRQFHKKSNRWSVYGEKVAKTYEHVTDIKRIVLDRRLQDHQGMQKSRPLEATDPRRISRHLAAIPPPPTATIVQDTISRRQ
ncbi:uncharacterized protein [Ptychodera flava]|uniref:uncharacterized protein n=1 Tax=Ptychodera flava TaxID=63121 RepID=UPI00396A823F